MVLKVIPEESQFEWSWLKILIGIQRFNFF